MIPLASTNRRPWKPSSGVHMVTKFYMKLWVLPMMTLVGVQSSLHRIQWNIRMVRKQRSQCVCHNFLVDHPCIRDVHSSCSFWHYRQSNKTGKLLLRWRAFLESLDTEMNESLWGQYWMGIILDICSSSTQQPSWYTYPPSWKAASTSFTWWIENCFDGSKCFETTACLFLNCFLTGTPQANVQETSKF